MQGKRMSALDKGRALGIIGGVFWYNAGYVRNEIIFGMVL